MLPDRSRAARVGPTEASRRPAVLKGFHRFVRWRTDLAIPELSNSVGRVVRTSGMQIDGTVTTTDGISVERPARGQLDEHTAQAVIAAYTATVMGSRAMRSTAFYAALRAYRTRHPGVSEATARCRVAEVLCFARSKRVGRRRCPRPRPAMDYAEGTTQNGRAFFPR